MFPWVAYGQFIPFLHLSNKLAQKGHKPETTSVVPIIQQKYLVFAVDQTRDQVEDILKVLKPDVVFYDFWFWIPQLARQLGICPILYGVVCSMSMALTTKEVKEEITGEDVLEVPPGYPSSTVRFKAEEVPPLLFAVEDFGSGLSFHQ
ncbi:hypothetical protein V6N13_048081 [Hibiscus sabdariffa]|uniref:Uncharacterized protein n=2 Tax=Hibiscus sabdariffa TaxID=183260 RepID=A0ABR1ZAE1_9ROSI